MSGDTSLSSYTDDDSLDNKSLSSNTDDDENESTPPPPKRRRNRRPKYPVINVYDPADPSDIKLTIDDAELRRDRHYNKLCYGANNTCETLPNYNFPGQAPAVFCYIHAQEFDERMVNIHSQICIFDGCETQASYNVPGETKLLYCSDHARYLGGMVSVYHKK